LEALPVPDEEGYVDQFISRISGLAHMLIVAEGVS
jgi:hypothetical protein